MSFTPMESVVVPIDFSESSVSAIQTAIECAKSPESVHVVHIVLDQEQVSPYGYWLVEDAKTRESKAREHMAKFLEENDIQGVRHVVLVGDAGRRIVEYADECKSDLIVIPSHGYHGFKRLLLGSTAERVIRHAHCAVYVLRRMDAG